MNFNEWLEESGMYLTDLCHKHNLPYQTCQSIKLGKHSPSLLNALKIYYASNKTINIKKLLTNKDQVDLKNRKSESYEKG